MGARLGQQRHQLRRRHAEVPASTAAISAASAAVSVGSAVTATAGWVEASTSPLRSVISPRAGSSGRVRGERVAAVGGGVEALQLQQPTGAQRQRHGNDDQQWCSRRVARRVVAEARGRRPRRHCVAVGTATTGRAVGERRGRRVRVPSVMQPLDFGGGRAVTDDCPAPLITAVLAFCCGLASQPRAACLAPLPLLRRGLVSAAFFLRGSTFSAAFASARAALAACSAAILGRRLHNEGRHLIAPHGMGLPMTLPLGSTRNAGYGLGRMPRADARRASSWGAASASSWFSRSAWAYASSVAWRFRARAWNAWSAASC